MSSYISSNANRFYAAIEASYGQAAAVTAADRFPAVELKAQQVLEAGRRLDKTGTRTFLGTPSTARRRTAFALKTYLTSWSGSSQPSYGALFQAALGGAPQLSSGLTVSAVQSGTQFQTATPHGLGVGSGVAYGNEVRFVKTVIDSATLEINAPFSTAPAANAALSPAMTYKLANGLPSLTIYDYWDPITAVSRTITGAGINTLNISVNGDFHEFAFEGPAADLLDSSSFVNGEAGLASYPAEPALIPFDYSIVPGHLGEAWLGGSTNQFFTLTSASIQVKNNIQTRNLEFGSSYPRAVAPGNREVQSNFSLYAQDDAQTTALYASAKLRTTTPAMLQLGQQQGQICGIYMPNIVPEIPAYNDSEPRLQWNFQNNLAQGVSNDEVFVAFA